MASNEEASSKPTGVKDEYPPFDFSAMSRMVNVSYFLLSSIICILYVVSAVFVY
jgi:hypothetical protein